MTPFDDRDFLNQVIPGEIICAEADVPINVGVPHSILRVQNAGDRPIQVGSHYHFAEVNQALLFDRAAARGMRLNIPSGAAVRFEPGQARDVTLVPYRGLRVVIGFQGAVMGKLDP